MSKNRHLSLEGKVPDEAHVLGYGSSQLATAYVPGALMGIVHNPKAPDYMARMILVEVKRDVLTFRCACNPTCKAVIRMIIHEQGAHHS